MSTSTSTSSEDEKLSKPKITLNQKSASKSNSFNRRDSLKKQQLAQLQRSQEQLKAAAVIMQQPKPDVEADVDLILKAATAAAANDDDSEGDMYRRKVIEWASSSAALAAAAAASQQADSAQARDHSVDGDQSQSTKQLEDEQRQKEEDEDERKMTVADVMSDSGPNNYDKRSTGDDLDKSGYDFMSSMQESNDEEQLLKKSLNLTDLKLSAVEVESDKTNVTQKPTEETETHATKSDNEAASGVQIGGMQFYHYSFDILRVFYLRE